jgi:hypothetical protein
LTWRRVIGRRVLALLAAGVLLPGVASPAHGELRVATGWRVEVAVTSVPRPVHLDLDAAGRLVVLSHGWRGDAAAEIYRLDLAGRLVDAARAPRVVIPFEGPRKVAFGSLAVDPRSGDLFLGEENGNRVYRLTAEERLNVFAVGLNHLLGGSSLTFDGGGRLVVLDYASPEVQLRSESPPPPALDSLNSDAYHGPLVLRVDPMDDLPTPRRLDLVGPLFPRGRPPRAGVEPLFRFISVAVGHAGELMLLDSVGQVFKLSAEHGLQRVANLPSGHYHRTHMAMGPDGSLFVSSGFHIRRLYRISPTGAVTTIAWDLGDPGGIAVDRAGSLYVAEGAIHRIIRISLY